MEDRSHLHASSHPARMRVPPRTNAPWLPHATHDISFRSPACSWPKDADEWKRLLSRLAPWLAAGAIVAASAYGYQKDRVGVGWLASKSQCSWRGGAPAAGQQLCKMVMRATLGACRVPAACLRASPHWWMLIPAFPCPPCSRGAPTARPWGPRWVGLVGVVRLRRRQLSAGGVP